MDLLEKYKWLKEQVGGFEFQALMNWLETNTDYLKSPASYKYHGAHEYGLLEHSVSVAATMLRMKKTLDPELSDEDCIIIALLHDCGKAGSIGVPLYTENEPTAKQKQYGYKASIPYSVNEGVTYMEHEMRSIFLIQSSATGFKLSEDMMAAILLHDDPWQGQRSAYRKNKLMTLLQMANYYSLLYLEGE